MMTASQTPGGRPAVSLEGLAVGDVVAERTVPIDRATLVRYAGASGDLNPIHYDDAVATSVGLPGVIAHGMLTMGTAVAVVTDWIGDPGAIREYGARFTKPVPVPGGGVTELSITATVGAVDPETGTVRLDLAAMAGGVSVLGRARATVALPAGGRGSAA